MRIEGKEGMYAEAARFAASLAPGAKATMVLLKGDLGTGKTTFVQGVAKHYGIEDRVTSPTFVIEKIYSITAGPYLRLVHIDAYRLSGLRELEVLGFGKLLSDPENLILLEWPERVEGLSAEGAKNVSFTFVDENTRDVMYT